MAELEVKIKGDNHKYTTNILTMSIKKHPISAHIDGRLKTAIQLVQARWNEKQLVAGNKHLNQHEVIEKLLMTALDSECPEWRTLKSNV